jgi:23S rRNA (uracil1939-C5)-methyltransferase
MDQIIKCKIKDFSKRGFGIGYYKHQVKDEMIPVEIAHTLIDDEVEVSVYKKRKRYRKGKLLNIIHPSPSRQIPKCKHVGLCGGCTWQEMNYLAQLSQKEKIILKLFKEFQTSEFKSILKCDNPFHYRNKMEFSFSENKAQTKFLGLMIAHASTYVFNLTECYLTNSWVATVVSAVRDFWEENQLFAFNQNDDSGHLRMLTVRESFTDHKKMVMLTVSGNPNFALNNKIIKSFVEAIKKALPNENPAIFLQIQQAIKNKPTQFFEMHLNGDVYLQEMLLINKKELSFKISPTSFFQPNSKQAEKLYAKALEITNPSDNDIVYDLYAGTGTLGMIFAKFVKKVIAIELNPHAVCDAKENLNLNNITNMEILQGDVGKVLSSSSSLVKPDLIVIDPPRAGLDEKALENISALLPKKILYISCNPYTQVENIKYLCTFGYRLKILQPIDQFPHTYHIENIAYLELET